METKVQRLVWSEDGKVLTLKYEKIGKSVVINTSLFPDSNHLDAQQHGYGQRFGDLEAGDKTGSLKYEAALALKAHYEAGGDWRMSADRDTTAVIFEALQRINSKYTKEGLEKVLEKNPEKFAEWKAHPQTKAMVAKIRAEKAAKAAKEAGTEKLEIEV